MFKGEDVSYLQFTLKQFHLSCINIKRERYEGGGGVVVMGGRKEEREGEEEGGRKEGNNNKYGKILKFGKSR